MQTIRRLYFYLVSFISLIVVVWGVIGLTRTIFGGKLIGNGANQLASALSLTAVGIPIFLLHWWLVQRTLDDDEEHFARLRAIFLYAVLLATFIPMVQNILAILNRSWLRIFNLPLRLAFIGEGQTWVDNLIAMIINGVIAAYIFTILRRNWDALHQKPPSVGTSLQSTRNLYRYIWVIYGLAMVVGGTQQLLQTILNISGVNIQNLGASLANGLTFLIIGIPLWTFSWRIVQRSIHPEISNPPIIRLIVLFVISLISIGGVLIPGGIFLSVILRALLGETMKFSLFLTDINVPLSTALPFSGVFFYYSQVLTKDLDTIPDPDYKAMLKRLYNYILSFAGLVTTFLGTNALLTFIIDTLVGTNNWAVHLRPRLSTSLAVIIIGIPLWVRHWRRTIVEASHEGEIGDHARRSLIRKIYLYLALFVGVLGIMISAGSLIFQILSNLLGSPPDNFQRTSLMLFEILILFSVLLTYHWSALRSDGHLADKTLTALHASFPVLILDTQPSDFTDIILESLQKKLPALPAIVHTLDSSLPDQGIPQVKAVVLPGYLTSDPPDEIQNWLQSFSGTRIVVPLDVDGWIWAYASGRSLPGLAAQTTKIIRHLAEGKNPPKIRESSPLTIILYVLAVIVGIPLIFGFISALVDILD